MQCEICKGECDEKQIVIDPLLTNATGKDELILCSTCFNLYGNQEFEKLCQRISRAPLQSAIFMAQDDSKPKKVRVSSQKELDRKKRTYQQNKEKILAYKKEYYIKKKAGDKNA